MQQLESTGCGIENEQIAIAKTKIIEVPITFKYGNHIPTEEQ